MQLGNRIYYSTCSLKAQHVSSGTSLIIRSSNCICSLWFKPEAANTVGAPDDE